MIRPLVKWENDVVGNESRYSNKGSQGFSEKISRAAYVEYKFGNEEMVVWRVIAAIFKEISTEVRLSQ
jgi:predicted secreted protein